MYVANAYIPMYICTLNLRIKTGESELQGQEKAGTTDTSNTTGKCFSQATRQLTCSYYIDLLYS